MEIAISSQQEAVRVPATQLRRLIRFVARAEGQRVAAVDLAVVDAHEITALNRRYAGRRKPTDVLCFDLADADSTGIVAQIVVCGDLAAAHGPPHGHRPAEELMLYVIHALLHLMGYDDTSARAAARMHAREAELLGEFLRSRRRSRK